MLRATFSTLLFFFFLSNSHLNVGLLLDVKIRRKEQEELHHSDQLRALAHGYNLLINLVAKPCAKQQNTQTKR